MILHQMNQSVMVYSTEVIALKVLRISGSRQFKFVLFKGESPIIMCNSQHPVVLTKHPGIYEGTGRRREGNISLRFTAGMRWK